MAVGSQAEKVLEREGGHLRGRGRRARLCRLQGGHQLQRVSRAERCPGLGSQGHFVDRETDKVSDAINILP